MNTQGKKFFYIILGLSLVTLAIFLRSYIGILLFSFLLAIVFQPFYAKTLDKVRNKQGIALALTFLLIILCFILPVIAAGLIIAYSVKDAAAGLNISRALSLEDIVEKINTLFANFGYSLGLTSEQVIDRISQYSAAAGSFLFGNITNIASSIFEVIPLLFIFFYVVGAVVINYQKISAYLHDLSPLDDIIDRLYVDRIKSMALSMVKGTFVVALVQGIVTGLFLWIAGVPYAFLLSLLAIIASIIPLGAGIITVPIGIILLLTGHIWQGILILLAQLLITANIDNILRPRLVNKKASLHPALILIGLFAGIANFGFMGLIYGPVFVIFLVTTIEVYKRYYR